MPEHGPTPAQDIEIARTAADSAREAMKKGESSVARAIHNMVKGHIESQGRNHLNIQAILAVEEYMLEDAAEAADPRLNRTATRWLHPHERPPKPAGRILIRDLGKNHPSYSYFGRNLTTLKIEYRVGSDSQVSTSERLGLEISFDDDENTLEAGYTRVNIEYTPGYEQGRNGIRKQIMDGKPFEEMLYNVNKLTQLQFIAELLYRATPAPVLEAATTS